MNNIELPISKSIANRVLIRQAYLGLPLMEVDPVRDPEDVVLLHDALLSNETSLNLGNCGTAMRFLTAYYAQKPGAYVILDGCERMRHRPIGQLVDALRLLGAEISYLGETGYPPLEIHGKALNHKTSSLNHKTSRLNKSLSTQFISALMLVGIDVETDIHSPYIDLTRAIVQDTEATGVSSSSAIERDWSSAAFWLERWALGLCEYPEFPGLNISSLQGDKECLPLFHRIHDMKRGETLSYDFTRCPDLYPSVAIACEVLGICLEATGTECLRYKESDRLQSVREHKTYQDHRVAMALLAADLACDDTECIGKSYPLYLEQLQKR